ncbi:MAG TPA: lipopolysaccharide heptosyltransferase II [Candidatus Brocadiaceae bacterium]
MNVLIVKPSSFGDIVQANPTLVALKKFYPDCNVSWLVFDMWKDVLSLFPDLDRVIIWRKRGGIKEFIHVVHLLRKEKYDLVIDLQGLARSALLTFISGAKKKIGVPGMKEFGWWFIREVFPESRSMNAVNRSLETVRYLTGKKIEPAFNLSVPPSAEREASDIIKSLGVSNSETTIGIVPFARGLSKQWPIEYYRQLIDLIVLHNNRVNILILGSKDNVGIIEHPNAIDLCGRTSLTQLAAVFKMCKVVIGSDTGPVHLAAALNVPVVVLFGGSDVRETAPVTDHATIITKNFPCSPCRSRPTCNDYPCLKEIKPQEVFEALNQVLK